MGQLTIRNVDDAVVQALRRRAAAAGRSTEEEARRLAMAVETNREAARAHLDAVRAKLAGHEDASAEQLVRKLRERRTRELSG